MCFNKSHQRMVTLLAVIFFCLIAENIFAAYLTDAPQTITQPDGTVIECFATGDEFYNWLHDADGFTIIRDDSGYYVYADKKDGELVSSELVVGKDKPKDKNLKPKINLDADKIGKIRVDRANKMKPPKPGSQPGDDVAVDQMDSGPEAAPTTGTINNIVVFISFADQIEYTDSISDYDDAFNKNDTPQAVSMINYFQEASYNQLTVSSTFYPAPSGGVVVSYQDSHDRAYFEIYHAANNPAGYNGDTEREIREHQLLVDAVNAVSSSIPSELNIDGDNDGRVDNVCFIIKGSTEGWSHLLWPHRWALYTHTVNINDKRVYDYNFQLSAYMSSSAFYGVSVLCHEMFHSLGSPDLYRYYASGAPVGTWDLMASNLNTPQHMTAYMKYRYAGWITSIPEITAEGVYSLPPLSTSSTNNCYKIASPNSSTEYFMVEYRSKTATPGDPGDPASFDRGLPGSGLIVYRINTNQDGIGNRDGPPDELYVYRPGGTVTANGSYSLAYFSSTAGRTDINDTTDPSSFLSDGSDGGLLISEIGAAGDTISFRVGLPPQEISVSVSAFEITDGTATPVDFGSTGVSTPLVKTFTIENRGYENLTIGTILITGTDAADFEVTSSPSSPLLPLDSTPFNVTFIPSQTGTKNANISIDNNDSDENPFDFPVSGTGFILPEMNVTGNSVTIADGDTTPSASDHTNFGDAGAFDTIVRTFTIDNTGAGDLTIGTITFTGSAASDFSISASPTSSVVPGGSTTFDISFTPTAGPSTKSATISIPNNDSNENPYNFDISGNKVNKSPEMSVEGNTATISNGDITPSVSDNTDFSDALADGETVAKTFTIRNTGSDPLTIGAISLSGAHATDFSVTSDPSSSVSKNGGTTTFAVIFDPSGSGTRTAEISIVNDDLDENPYNFAIQGKGIIYGDINGDSTLDLADAIIALQILSNVDMGATTLSMDADVNGDGKIGTEDAIYILQKVSNLR